jgi:hypothetical protein
VIVKGAFADTNKASRGVMPRYMPFRLVFLLHFHYEPAKLAPEITTIALTPVAG